MSTVIAKGKFPVWTVVRTVLVVASITEIDAASKFAT